MTFAVSQKRHPNQSKVRPSGVVENLYGGFRRPRRRHDWNG
jgi:hypothetical protein